MKQRKIFTFYFEDESSLRQCGVDVTLKVAEYITQLCPHFRIHSKALGSIQLQCRPSQQFFGLLVTYLNPNRKGEAAHVKLMEKPHNNLEIAIAAEDTAQHPKWLLYNNLVNYLQEYAKSPEHGLAGYSVHPTPLEQKLQLTQNSNL